MQLVIGRFPWGRADKRACNGTCRMRVSRMRRGQRSPNLLQRPTADSAQASESGTLQRRHPTREGGTSRAGAARLAAAMRGAGSRASVQLVKELADQKVTAAEHERRQSEETKRCDRNCLTSRTTLSGTRDAKQQIAELPEERDVLRELLTECEISRDELQRERDERQRSQFLAAKLGQAEQA